jgi:DNA polymerase-3 subunit alpha
VGRALVESLIAEREANGPFSGLTEFCQRLGTEKLNRRALEALVKSGATDALGESRNGLVHEVPEALKSADQAAKAAAAGQNDMFGLAAEAPAEPVDSAARITMAEWPEQVLLANEKEALGLYLTGHPFDAVRKDARFFVDGKLGDLAKEAPPETSGGERDYARARREASVAGLIVDIRKRGNRMSVVLDDDTGRMEVALFSEAQEEFRHLIVKDEIVVAQGTLRYDDFIGAWALNAKSLTAIDRVIESRAKSMLLKLAPNGHGDKLLAELHDALLPYRQGHCDVAVEYYGSGAAARLSLGPEWTVRPSRELREKLTELLGSGSVRMLYTPGKEIM